MCVDVYSGHLITSQHADCKTESLVMLTQEPCYIRVAAAGLGGLQLNSLRLLNHPAGEQRSAGSRMWTSHRHHRHGSLRKQARSRQCRSAGRSGSLSNQCLIEQTVTTWPRRAAPRTGRWRAAPGLPAGQLPGLNSYQRQAIGWWPDSVSDLRDRLVAILCIRPP